MSFDSILRAIVEGCSGAIGAALMSSDGIPIEEVRGRGAEQGPLGEEIAAAGVEFGRILDEVGKASDALGAGALEELVITLARLVLLFRVVDEETFVVVALGPDANLGKARYLVRRHLHALREQL